MARNKCCGHQKGPDRKKRQAEEKKWQRISQLSYQKKQNKKLGISNEPEPESWKAFWCVGVLFPLHIVLGIALIPIIGYYLFIERSVNVLICCLIYSPFYFNNAHKQYPGWKGNEAMWSFMDYGNTARSYFNKFEVHGKEKIKKDIQYCIACHPHGTVIFQRTFWRCEILNQIFTKPWRMIAASALFWIPIVREMTLWFGAVDASKKTCEKILSEGASLVLYPGGLDEANIPTSTSDSDSDNVSNSNSNSNGDSNSSILEELANDGLTIDDDGIIRDDNGCRYIDKERELFLAPNGKPYDIIHNNSVPGPDVVIRTRTGFIRLAIKYNTPIVPIFTFGELEAVNAVNVLPDCLTKYLQKTFRMSTTIFIGRFFTFIPFRVPFHMCIGKPINVNKYSDSNSESDSESDSNSDSYAADAADADDADEIDIEVKVKRIHSLYKKELINIYNKYKWEYGYGNRKLVFLCEKLEEEKEEKANKAAEAAQAAEANKAAEAAQAAQAAEAATTLTTSGKKKNRGRSRRG